ncbi:MAG: DinB family protein [Acidobacteriota bacterium]
MTDSTSTPQIVRTDAAAIQIYYNLGALQMNVDSISHEESVRIPGGAGNCLNWIVGHLVRTRGTILGLVGDRESYAEAVDAAVYGRGTSMPADDPEGTAMPFDHLVELFAAAQPRLLAGFAALSDEQLLEPAPFSPRGSDNETLGSLLAGLSFHEAYHVGQTGLLRRQLGYAGRIA